MLKCLSRSVPSGWDAAPGDRSAVVSGTREILSHRTPVALMGSVYYPSPVQWNVSGVCRQKTAGVPDRGAVGGDGAPPEHADTEWATPWECLRSRRERDGNREQSPWETEMDAWLPQAPFSAEIVWPDFYIEVRVTPLRALRRGAPLWGAERWSEQSSTHGGSRGCCVTAAGDSPWLILGSHKWHQELLYIH